MLERRHAGLRVELSVIRTSGDQITEKPLYEFGGKGLFTKELEEALLAGSIDFAVHSFKDVPVTMPLVDPTRLVIAAVPAREDPRDALVSGKARSIAELANAAKVGTGSLRRRSQLLNLRPDLMVEPVRGNIDTRLRKCRSGEFEAVVLAMAGLRRAGLFDAGMMHVVEPEELLPAPGQGALALQCRRDDRRTRELLAVLNDPSTEACVAAERHLVQLLAGDCHSPIAALAAIDGAGMNLRAAVGGRNGTPPVIKASACGSVDEGARLAQSVYAKLLEQGAQVLLHGRM